MGSNCAFTLQTYNFQTNSYETVHYVRINKNMEQSLYKPLLDQSQMTQCSESSIDITTPESPPQPTPASDVPKPQRCNSHAAHPNVIRCAGCATLLSYPSNIYCVSCPKCSTLTAVQALGSTICPYCQKVLMHPYNADTVNCTSCNKPYYTPLVGRSRLGSI